MVPSKFVALLLLAALGFVGDCSPQPQVGFFPLPTLQIDDD
jgi:hypothetical protein